MNEYLTKSSLIYVFQSGFRKSHSTDTSLLYLTDFIRRQIDEGKMCGMVLLDLQKAFDTVNHSILLDKLSVMGFSSKVITWFNSYLSERVQRVEIDGVLSEETLVKNGVPQGSVLGPLLFLLYINDMQAVCDCNLFLYADDSALLISDKDVGRIQENLGKELCKVRDWLSENKLMLHLGKTESILFGSKQNLNKVSKLSVRVGDCLISNQTSVNYLGCILDNDLSGVSMAMKVLGKVNARTKFLARHVSFLDKQLMKLLASCLVSCHYDYACISWMSDLSRGWLDKLQKSQNKLIRLVSGFSRFTHVEVSHFKCLDWLPIESRLEYIKLKMVHKMINNRAPSYFNVLFSRVNEQHCYRTRQSLMDITLCRFKTMYGRRSFRYSGALLWNKLPLDIKDISSMVSFSLKTKSWLLSRLLCWWIYIMYIVIRDCKVL